MSKLLHILYSPRAEGCPRLVLELIKQNLKHSNDISYVAFCTYIPPDLLDSFHDIGTQTFNLNWREHGFFKLFIGSYKLIREINPTGIVCYTVGQHVSIGLAARLLKIPMVLHIGCAPPIGNDNKYSLLKIKIQMYIGLPFVIKYVPCSKYVANESINTYSLPEKKVSVIYNGIDMSKFASVRIDHKNSSDRLRIGMVGSIESSRNYSLLIKSFALLNKNIPNSELNIIGRGSMENECKQLTKNLNIDVNVFWHGTILDVTKILKEIDVFAFCVNESEGLGIALIEALVAGLPVVASDVTACREILKNGRWGKLVSKNNPESWASALIGFREILVPNSDELKCFDINETYKAYESLFNSL